MIKVLMFSRGANWYGGVVNFVESIRSNIGPEIELHVFTIGRRKGIKGVLLRPFLPIFDAVRLSVLLLQNNYDAYHLNPSLDIPSLVRDGLFLIILRSHKAKNVYVFFHGWKKSVEKAINNNRLFKYLFFKIFSYARRTLVLADDAKNALISLGFEEKYIQLYTTMFDSRIFNKNERKKKSVCTEILFLSRLVQGKGAYELVAAFSCICEQYRNVKLTIAGTGPEEAGLKKLVRESNIEDKVEFTGYVRDKEKAEILNRSDIFVLASATEGCPVSMLEAMASGLAIIATPVGGIPRIIVDGVNGLLIEDSSSEAIETALRNMLDDSKLVKSMSDVNRLEAWKKYNASVVTRSFELLYCESDN